MNIDNSSSVKFVFTSMFLISLLTSNPELSALILSGAYLYFLGHHANMMLLLSSWSSMNYFSLL